MNEINFGKAIKKARNNVGMTQRDLAKSIGVTLGTIHRYERSINDIPLGNVNKITNALGITYEDLIAGSYEVHDDPERKLNHYASITYETDSAVRYARIKIKDKDDPIFANDSGFVVINGFDKTLIFNIKKIIYIVTFVTNNEMEDVFGD